MSGFNQRKIGMLVLVFAILLIFILIFVKTNTDERGALLCKVISDNPEMNMEDCPAHTDNTSWLIVGAFAMAFLVFGAGIYLVFVPIKKGESEVKKVDISKLDEEEKKIYAILKEDDGSAYQSDIIKKTGLSKVAVTRILDKMEGKKLLDRKRRGMTNIIILR